MRAWCMVAALSTTLVLGGGATRSEETPCLGAHGLRLPATFTGTLPCADCQGIRAHLDLWTDPSFGFRREWLGGREPLTEDVLGRWYVDPSHGTLILDGVADEPAQWAISGPDLLRALGPDGRPASSGLAYDLVGGPLDPGDLRLTARGLFTYVADTARFVDCRSGQDLPVATESAYPDLEAAYLSVRSGPQEPIIAEVTGRIELRPAMEGLAVRALVVDQVLAATPDGTCLPEPSPPRLVNTIWRLTSLQGLVLSARPDHPEPHLLLRDDGRFSATVGCNRLAGNFESDDSAFRFGSVTTTRMGCPEPLADEEAKLITALEGTQSLHLDAGGRRVLRGLRGELLGELEAAYVSP